MESDTNFNKEGCRMYQQLYPNVDDLVMCKVIAIGEMGVYVQLLEYNMIEGLVQLSELSRKRFKNIKQLTKIGKFEVLSTIRVDVEHGYIDLSKKRVTDDDINMHTNRYHKSKAVDNVIRHISIKTNRPLLNLYQTIVWPLTDQECHVYDLIFIQKNKIVLDDAILQNILEEIILQKILDYSIKIKAQIEINCYGYDGIDAIRDSLMAGKKCETDIKLNINLLVSPTYEICVVALDQTKGIDTINHVIHNIQSTINRYDGGFFKVTKEPYIVTSNVNESKIENSDLSIAMKEHCTI
jgi:translation initiation factor 2 subunit 1